MRRHSTDLVGLIFGTAFAIAGVGFLVNEATDTVVNAAWATGLGLMLLGAVALVATLIRGPRDRDRDPAYADAYTHDPAPGDVVTEAEAPTVEATVTSDE